MADAGHDLYLFRRRTGADLSAGYDPNDWPALWAEFGCDWRRYAFNLGVDPPTWYMADDVIDAGLEGILFPSQAHSGGTNLVIFDSSTRTKSQLQVHDPDGALPKTQDSWRSPT